MTTIRAALRTYDQIESMAVRSPLEAIASLRRAATDLAARVDARLRRRGTMRIIADLSDHRLSDIGFERDWDGSVIAVTGGIRRQR